MSVPSSELGPHHPQPTSECETPLEPKGRDILAGDGVGGSNSVDWIESLELCVPSNGTLLSVDEPATVKSGRHQKTYICGIVLLKRSNSSLISTKLEKASEDLDALISFLKLS